MNVQKQVFAILKTGHRVWVGNMHNSRKRIETVERTTATLIILGKSEFDSFRIIALFASIIEARSLR